MALIIDQNLEFLQLQDPPTSTGYSGVVEKVFWSVNWRIENYSWCPDKQYSLEQLEKIRDLIPFISQYNWICLCQKSKTSSSPVIIYELSKLI